MRVALAVFSWRRGVGGRAERSLVLIGAPHAGLAWCWSFPGVVHRRAPVAWKRRCADRLVIELVLCDGIDVSGNLALEVAGGDGEFSSRPFCPSSVFRICCWYCRSSFESGQQFESRCVADHHL